MTPELTSADYRRMKLSMASDDETSSASEFESGTDRSPAIHLTIKPGASRDIRHGSSCHGDEKRVYTSMMKLEKIRYECRLCDFSSNSGVEEVKLHILLGHHDIHRMCCRYCAFSAASRDKVEHHCTEMHTNKPPLVIDLLHEHDDKFHLTTIKDTVQVTRARNYNISVTTRGPG